MYRKILLAIDGGHASRLATIEVAALAKAMDAALEVVYVLDDREPLFEVAYLDRNELWRCMAELGRGALRAAGDVLAAAGVTCTLVLADKCVKPGRIAETIVAKAEGWDADLIAMGTHGRHGMQRVLMGSVARSVLMQWDGPVLLTRSGVDD